MDGRKEKPSVCIWSPFKIQKADAVSLCSHPRYIVWYYAFKSFCGKQRWKWKRFKQWCMMLILLYFLIPVAWCRSWRQTCFGGISAGSGKSARSRLKVLWGRPKVIQEGINHRPVSPTHSGAESLECLHVESTVDSSDTTPVPLKPI